MGRARKEELDRLWWQEAAETGEGPAGAPRAELAADEAGWDTWQVLPVYVLRGRVCKFSAPGVQRKDTARIEPIGHEARWDTWKVVPSQNTDGLREQGVRNSQHQAFSERRPSSCARGDSVWEPDGTVYLVSVTLLRRRGVVTGTCAT